MRQYDKFERLAFVAEFPVAVLGNPATSDLELVDVTEPVPEDIRIRVQGRGLAFVGAVGLVGGVPRTALEAPLNALTISALASAYIRHVEARVNAALEVASLTRLHGLPDTRPN